MEKIPDEIEDALRIIYEAASIFVESGSSRSANMLKGAPFSVKEVMDSRGKIGPRDLAKKLWELLERDEQSKHLMGVLDLRSLSIRLCRQMANWAEDAENTFLALQSAAQETKAKEARRRYNSLERAHQCFPPNDEISIRILSMLIFEPFQPLRNVLPEDEEVMARVTGSIPTHGSHTKLTPEIEEAIDVLVERIRNLKYSYPIRQSTRRFDEEVSSEDSEDECGSSVDSEDSDVSMSEDEDASDEHADKLIAST